MGAAPSRIQIPAIKSPVILPGDERIRVSSLLKDPNKLLENDGNGMNTVANLFEAGVKIAGEKPCLGSRKNEEDEYEWLNYSETDRRAKCIGSALKLKNLNSNLIAIRCKNRPEWTITAIGCAYYSFTICTINFTTPYDIMKKIIQQAKFEIFICGNEEDAQWVVKNYSEIPSLKYLVVMDSIKELDILEIGKVNGLEIISFDDLMEFGQNNIQEKIIPKPEETYTICYTSGTTGDPKGVMISHKALMSCVAGFAMSFASGFEYKSTISYLPVAHVFEICCELYTLKNGGKIGFYRGDIKGLLKDIQKLQPNCMPVVPRLLNRIYLEAMNAVNGSAVKKYMMDWALQSKSAAIKSGYGKTIWDHVVFPKIKNLLGGNIEILLVASAPISTEVKAFFKCALDCLMYEAYGQTETAAVTLTDPSEWDAGHVGFPLPTCQIKVIDVPEMNYFAKDDVGEICIRGPSLMTGYHNRSDLTAETIDETGWLHTGDIGKWLPSGALKIIDRKKNIFKLSQGEYIAPEKVENAYSHCNLVSQIFVDGVSTENYCIALVVPNFPVFTKWAKSHGKENDVEILCDDKEIIELLMKELHKEGKKACLNSLEQAKKIKILPKAISIEDGLLTDTLKIKRLATRKHFENEIKALY